MSTVDREQMFDQETRQDRIDKRLEMLDSAVFKPNKEKGRTIFDDYQDLINKVQTDSLDNMNQMKDLVSESADAINMKFDAQDI